MPGNLGALFGVILIATFASGCDTRIEEAFYLESAVLRDADVHRRLRTAIRKDLPDTVQSEFAVTGHRISKGQGIIFAMRLFTAPFTTFTDAAEFKKLTISLPRLFADGSEEIDLSNSDTIVYWSHGASSFPGDTGCHGYAIAGFFRFNRVGSDTILADVEMEVKKRSPLGWEGECGKITIKKRFEFVRIEHKDLTPWRGDVGGHIYDEAFSPRK